MVNAVISTCLLQREDVGRFLHNANLGMVTFCVLADAAGIAISAVKTDGAKLYSFLQG
jgi:hypothetical protein